jgi:co-chaperonin GroES (HSP10)
MIQAHGDNVLVKELQPPQKEGSLIVMPDTAKNEVRFGRVQSFGKKVEKIDVGDVVAYMVVPKMEFPKVMGLVAINDDAVLCVVEKAPEKLAENTI